MKRRHDHKDHEFYWLYQLLLKIDKKINKIMSKQVDLTQEMTAITAQIAKIGTESAATLQKVTDLEEALANQDNVTPELQAAFDALKTQVTVVDDLIPDATGK